MQFSPTEKFNRQEPDKDRIEETTILPNVDDILKRTEELWTGDMDPGMVANAIHEVAGMIHPFDKVMRDILIQEVSMLTKVSKSAFNKAVKAVDEESKPREYDVDGLPKHINPRDFIKYGFYADKNRYFFKTQNGIIPLSNFTMEPLFHVISLTNSKRLYEITNEYDINEVIELTMDELTSLTAFNKHIEGIGNFLFEGSSSHLIKLKRYWYDMTKTCYEVTQMGWQRQGFYAWGNGAMSDRWQDIDDLGIITHHGRNYYIPALSKIFASDHTLFIAERKFIHTPSEIKYHEVAAQLHQVFGNNGIIGLSFVIATIMKDVIVGITTNFPILNFFGPKGCGKTALAHTLLKFFLNETKLTNIHNTTMPGLSDVVSAVSNALVGIDEYKNDLDFNKIEYLKSLYDGIGRTRMNMDKDRKKETTRVDCGVVLCGQEMPTADIALFSRLIFCTFHKSEYSEEESKLYKNLKALEKNGFTSLTNELLSHRKFFEENYQYSFNIVWKDLQAAAVNTKIEERTLKNYAIVLAAVHVVRDRIIIGFDYQRLLGIFVQNMVDQNNFTRSNNELAVFWTILEYLLKEGLIENEVDFRIEHFVQLKLKERSIEFSSSTPVLFLNHSRIFQLYRKHGLQSKENVLPINTLKYYLENSKPYIGVKPSVAFKNQDAREDMDGKKKYHVTTAMAFLFNELGIDINHQKLSESDFEFDETGKKKQYRTDF